ncbi:hypothetical protein BD626DRAFT_480140 [Schizophyllum amplum]|uniref:Mitochondrial distribution and morphology protein 34 n=1 Tax=Schizophyllum amplum TaxID=97359 RepID=A0A550CT02_9AGAR|nr:hypothetical protein BD626DRAFT_480140 [Auriculariopsis ampla]
MSFTFKWPRFSDQFHYDAIQLLNNALNKGDKPPVIADKIEVVELEMGTQPPELEIKDIGELTPDQFRGIFRLTYAGDAHIVLKTKVQANPLNHKQPDIHMLSGSRGMLAAKHPLVVPMHLRLSHFKLNSYVVLVVSKQKGITLVFKTDPLQNVDINSTFDSIAVIQKFIQKEIEGQLRQMFREDLPGIIHRLSQQWVKAKVEAPYQRRPPAAPSSVPTSPRPPPSVRSTVTTPSYATPPRPLRRTSVAASSTRSTRSTPAPSPLATRSTTPDDAETDDFAYDPTYGLRPEGVPQKSNFHSFGSLFAKPTRGLADLAEETEDSSSTAADLDSQYDVDDLVSEPFDVVDWGDPHGEPVSYETVPAIGGGTITRPRVLHTHSRAMTPDPRTPPSRSPFALGRLHEGMRSMSNPYFADAIIPETPQSMSRHRSFDEELDSDHHASQSSSSIATPPDFSPPPRETPIPAAPASPLDSQSPFLSASPPSEDDSVHEKIVLRPNLSPYTRSGSLAHFAVRSGPPRPVQREEREGEGRPRKARRKRTYRLGGKKTPQEIPPVEEEPRRRSEEPASPLPPMSDSEFEYDEEDMDRYFRRATVPKGVTPMSGPPSFGGSRAASFTGSMPRRGPEMHPTHIRRRGESARGGLGLGTFGYP